MYISQLSAAAPKVNSSHVETECTFRYGAGGKLCRLADLQIISSDGHSTEQRSTTQGGLEAQSQVIETSSPCSCNPDDPLSLTAAFDSPNATLIMETLVLFGSKRHKPVSEPDLIVAASRQRLAFASCIGQANRASAQHGTT